jgi:hypothetical protein
MPGGQDWEGEGKRRGKGSEHLPHMYGCGTLKPVEVTLRRGRKGGRGRIMEEMNQTGLH